MTQNVAQLFDGNMLVRLMPIESGWPPPNRIVTPRLVPPRFEAYEEGLPASQIVTDTWSRVGHSALSGDWVTVEFWIEHFKVNPPEYDERTFQVPVVWWKYERIG